MSPSHQTAIVTGSAQGIGRAITLRLAHDGLDVVVNDIPVKTQQLDTLLVEIEAVTGRRALIVLGNVSREDDVRHLVDTAVAEFGGLDVMILNAGVAYIGPLTETPVEEWDRVQRINLRSMFLCYKAAAAQMIKQGRCMVIGQF